VAATFDRTTTIGEWTVRAECRQTRSGLFYAPFGESSLARRDREELAKQICEQCPARTECLDHALRSNQDLGIWGGLNEAERRRLVS
jgi:WhiB family redox-sensing transcriptional regulator